MAKGYVKWMHAADASQGSAFAYEIWGQVADMGSSEDDLGVSVFFSLLSKNAGSSVICL